MTQEKLNRLIEVLSVPTHSRDEKLMIEYLQKVLTQKGYNHYTDSHGNIYVTKGNSKHFPCFVAHTDTVHKVNLNLQVLQTESVEDGVMLTGIDKKTGKPSGIGGDDKCGVFACLKLLKELPFLKAAFFVSEETGCHGSRKANKDFFQDVGYAIQFDAPENWMVTEKCFGQTLFNRQSEFFESCDNVLTESMSHGDLKYMVHPYTDVYALSNRFNFSCINISIGYYDYHTKNEYVVVEDVFNGIEMGRKMIEKLGYRHHKMEKVEQPPNKNLIL